MPSLVVPTIAAGSLASRAQPTLDAGDGVLLRPWILTDATAVVEAYRDPEIQRWHVKRADSLGEAEEWIAARQSGWPAEREASWAVVDADSDMLLGQAALKWMEFTSGTAEVAYWIVHARLRER